MACSFVFIGRGAGKDGRVFSDKRTQLGSPSVGREVALAALLGVVKCDADLMQVVLAGGHPGSLSHSLYGRQQQGHQHDDDGDHDQQLDEREGGPCKDALRPRATVKVVSVFHLSLFLLVAIELSYSPDPVLVVMLNHCDHPDSLLARSVSAEAEIGA